MKKPTLAGGRIMLAAIVIVAAGCATRNYKKPIAGFNTASAQVIVAAKNYYEFANKIERDHLVDDHAATGETIDPKELRAVSERFRVEDIAVRLEALEVLAAYGSLLLHLATSDAPGDVNTQVDALSASVGGLSDRLDKLCTDCSAENQKFKTAFGATASIVKPILNQMLKSKSDKGLSRDIKNAQKPVSDLIGALRDDLRNLYERRRQALSLRLSDAIRAYNNEAKLGAASNKERLLIYAGRAKLAADRVEQLPLASPDAALDAMDKAHQALVAFANKKKTAQTLAELADAVQVFAVKAQQVSRETRTLVEL